MLQYIKNRRKKTRKKILYHNVIQPYIKLSILSRLHCLKSAFLSKKKLVKWRYYLSDDKNCEPTLVASLGAARSRSYSITRFNTSLHLSYSRVQWYSSARAQMKRRWTLEHVLLQVYLFTSLGMAFCFLSLLSCPLFS